MNPITEREHADLVSRVDRVEGRVERLTDRVDVVEGRMDRFDGMFTLLRLIFGTSLVGALLALFALVEILQHSGVAR